MPGNLPDRIDILLRNGRIIRNIDPKGWRWKAWREHPEWEYDVVHWRECVK
jgi:hypothetical protein